MEPNKSTQKPKPGGMMPEDAFIPEMKCPKCGEEKVVLESLDEYDGWAAHLRCTQCDHEWRDYLLMD